MSGGDLHSWAETTVYPRGEGGADAPSHGDECPVCEEPLNEGEQAHRVTERDDDRWVHDQHVWRESDG